MTVTTPLEDSNLALIGSDEDKAAREAAAALEVNWAGAGETVGLQIWRVENTRDEHGNAKFGIHPWPKAQYGEFYRGDSYIVLQTTRVNDKLQWDIYFWIGSSSSQDEYGVAAYKANELDDLLGDAPVQHRETEGYESEQFLEMFDSIKYLEGGIDSGFRQIKEHVTPVELPKRLFWVRKIKGHTRSYLVPLSIKSLNQGDAFVLDAGETVYTWYGKDCSPFEKSKAVETGHNMVEARHGHAHLVVDVQEDTGADEFWDLLGGKGPIQEASAVTDDAFQPDEHSAKMYVLREEDSVLKIDHVPEPSKSKLSTGDVCLIDIGTTIFVWVGKGASKREQSQGMCIVQAHLKANHRERNTQVMRVLEGQEGRCRAWKKVF